MITSTQSYTAHSIKVLKGLEAVKKRPGMYIGDTEDGSGLHHMVYEVTDNAVDEALAGYCNKIIIILNKNGSVTITDNGRGIPVDIHEDEGISAAELIMTQLHAGAKFDENSYKISGGLHGVGVSVVNALSEWLELVVWRDKKKYMMRFEHGKKTKELNYVTSDSPNRSGTQITFLPSNKIFSHTIFNFTTLEYRYKELAFLNPEISIELCDKRSSVVKSANLHFKGGILSFIQHLDKGKNIINKTIIIVGELNNISINTAFQWNTSDNENIIAFTNNIRQKDGGTHLTGVKGAITRVINNYIEKYYLQKKQKVKIIPDDMREGLTSIISIRIADPKFSSQTKDKLISGEVRATVESIVFEKLIRWFETNPKDAKLLINRMTESAISREAAKRARNLSRKQVSSQVLTLPGKLASCQEKDPRNAELFLVEGDSAGGSAKQGRNRKNQAILPLKGKILNVEKAKINKILNFPEIGTLITALGIVLNNKEFNMTKLRYHKIIIMTDADVDGAHIRTLLLTFFFRYMPTLILKGYLYIAQPPLYRIKKGQHDVYLKNKASLHNYLEDIVLKNSTIKYNSKILDVDNKKLFIARITNFSSIIKNHKGKIPTYIIETLLFLGFFDAGIKNKMNYNYLTSKLNSLFNKKHIEWKITESESEIRVYKFERGVQEIFKIKRDLFLGKSRELITDLVSHLSTFVQEGSFYYDKKNIFNNITISQLVENIFTSAKRGLYIQRFKGLGEMNPDQLWSTTLDPNNRTLLQIKIEDMDNAKNIFTILMGDIVETRKEFIYQNALKAMNLDY